MRTKQKLIILLISISSIQNKLIFKDQGSTFDGFNIAKPNAKTEDSDLKAKGEDSYSTTKYGMTVSDGVSESEMNSFLISELLSIACSKFYIDCNSKQKSSPVVVGAEKIKELSLLDFSKNFTDLQSFETQLEKAINSFIYSLKDSIREKLDVDLKSQDYSNEEAEKFIGWGEHPKIYTKQDFENNQNKEKELMDVNYASILQKKIQPIENKKFKINSERVLQATLITATPVKKDEEDLLYVYQFGDSLLAAFKIEKLPDSKKAILTPFFISSLWYKQSTSGPDMIDDQFLLSTEKYGTFKKKKEFSQWKNDNDLKKGSEKRGNYYELPNAYEIKIAKNDVVISASDGVWDNLPLGLVTYLLNYITKYLIENPLISPEKVKREMNEGLEIIISEFFKFASDESNFSKKSMDRLMDISYYSLHISQYYNYKFKNEQPFESRPKEGKPFNKCTNYEIFFVKTIDSTKKSRDDKNLLSDCLTNILKENVAFDLDSEGDLLPAYFNNELVSEFVASAAKMIMILSNLVINANQKKDEKEQEKYFNEFLENFKLHSGSSGISEQTKSIVLTSINIAKKLEIFSYSEDKKKMITSQKVFLSPHSIENSYARFLSVYKYIKKEQKKSKRL